MGILCDIQYDAITVRECIFQWCWFHSDRKYIPFLKYLDSTHAHPRFLLSIDYKYYQELMSRPKELPTSHYSMQQHLTLNDYHTFLLWNYSQVGSFPLWLLHEGVRHE